MSVSVCFILGLLLWTRAGGSSSQTRFIQTHRDLLLMVTEEAQIGRDMFLWRFNNSNYIIRLHRGQVYNVDDYYKRVEFFNQNLSLILKNVQLSDSGIYTAVVSRKKDEILSTYDVRVQAPVSPVLLSVDPVSFSPESCHFTVSCGTELSPSISRSFTCDRRTCEEASPAPSDPAPSLQLVSNHSNQVRPTQGTKSCRETCQEAAGEESERSWCLVKTVVFSVGLLLMVSSVITVHVLDCTRKKHN